MKKVFGKICIAAAIAVAAGALIWIIGMSFIGWDFMRLDTTTYTSKKYEAQAPIEHVVLDIGSYPIEITEGEKVELSYYESTDSDVTVTEDKGVLRIHERYRFDPFKNGVFNVGRSSHKYALTVVSGVTFDISSSNGDIRFNGVELDSFCVESSNLDLEFTDCSIDEFDIDATNADIRLENCEISQMKVKGTNQDITLKNCSGERATLDGTNLHASIAYCEYDSFTAHATNADVELKGGEYGAIKLDGTNGDYSLERVRVDTAELAATNLDAEVSILGRASDYTVVCSGKRLPPQRTGNTDKKISFKGTNNDVELEFVS